VLLIAAEESPNQKNQGGLDIPGFALRSQEMFQDHVTIDRDDLPDFIVKKLQVNATLSPDNQRSYWNMMLNIETIGDLSKGVENEGEQQEIPAKIHLVYSLMYDEITPQACVRVYQQNANIERRLEIDPPQSTHQQYSMPDVFQLTIASHKECRPVGIRVDFDISGGKREGLIMESNERNNSLYVTITNWPIKNEWMGELK
jgi:hypothetical protein